jgi:acylphosphatase
MRRRVIVRGRVQGVGFRWFVREHARTLGLSGWVKNLLDGLVELEVEGPDHRVDELMTLVAEGPDGAVVAAVEDQLIAEPDAELPNPFTIVR